MAKPEKSIVSSGIAAAVLGGALLLSSGCTRRIYVPVERCVRDTIRETRANIDSVIDRDSIYLAVKGDTTIKEVYRWRTRTRVRTDTVYRVRHDSVPVVIKEPTAPRPPKKPTLKERFMMSLESGARFLTALLLLSAFVYLLVRFRRK